ncbi:MAG: hypothetical protein KDC98_23435 [Planctomycetes bacterium]|nr:hypothetical protein [Planctomycetota bacterium]
MITSRSAVLLLALAACGTGHRSDFQVPDATITAMTAQPTPATSTTAPTRPTATLQTATFALG